MSNSPVFQKFSAALAGKLAQRYGSNPHVKCWHVVKVSFLDQYDKNYNHEIEVQVPVKVEGVNLKDGEFTLKPLVMHVNEVNDDLRPLPVEELESWHETDGTKTLKGQALRSLVKSVTWS